MPSAASLDPAVKNAESAAEGLEKKLKAKPSDSKLKMATAEAWYKAGFACEYSKKSLPARARYRTALKHYRRALTLNPSHAGAKKEKDQIEQPLRPGHRIDLDPGAVRATLAELRERSDIPGKANERKMGWAPSVIAMC